MKDLVVLLILLLIVLGVLFYSGVLSIDDFVECDDIEVELTELQIVRAPTDFGDNDVGEECFFFLGSDNPDDEDDPNSEIIASQRFLATWNVTHTGSLGDINYVVDWQAPGFEQNLTVVSGSQYIHDGGLALKAQASLPCFEGESSMNQTQITITAISSMVYVHGVEWSKTGNTIFASWDGIAGVDSYIVSAKVERLQVIDPNGEMEIFPVTYAYHGGQTDSTSAVIELPSYDIYNDDLLSEYGMVQSVTVWGFKSCNIQDSLITFV